jgi:hypothetical protein
MQSLEKTERKKQWKRVRAEVNRIVDRAGKPIDRGIKDGIAIIRIFGFETRKSCWGHPNRGRRAPWIEFGNYLSRERFNEIRKGKTSEAIHQVPEIRNIRKNNLKAHERLMELLDEFYKGRDTPFDVRLTIIISGGIFLDAQLASAGASLQRSRTKEKQREKLERYREEMKAFTNFLKNKYF